MAEIAENDDLCDLDDIMGCKIFLATCLIRFCISEPNGMLKAFYLKKWFTHDDATTSTIMLGI